MAGPVSFATVRSSTCMSVGVGDLSSDVGRTQHRNLGLRDWKSESFESWKFFSLRVDSAKHDDCHAYNQKKLAHAHLRSKARDGCPARREISSAMLRQNLLICRSTSNSIPRAHNHELCIGE